MTDQLGPYHLHLHQDDEAKELVRRFHYSHRVPSNIQLIATAHEVGGLFGDLGPAVAACFVSIPGSGHHSYKDPEYVFAVAKPVDTLELTRLVRRDDVTISWTGLISWAMQWTRALKLGDLVISYADVQQGHHGGVYQAASWQYDGLRKPNAEGVLLDDEHFVPMRTIISHKRAREQYTDRKVTIKKDQGKHCYWKALTRSGWKKATLLRLRSLPYPKPDPENGPPQTFRATGPVGPVQPLPDSLLPS
jgi:hypothetical protein